MRSLLVLGIGLALAVAVATIAVVLSRGETVIAEPIDIEAHLAEADALQQELDRLHARYESRVEGLARGILGRSAGDNTFSVERDAVRVVGVRTLSALNFARPEDGVHREVSETDERETVFDPARFPQAIAEGAPQLAESRGEVRVWSEEEFPEGAGSSGWLREEEAVFYFWHRRFVGEVSLVGIDGESVRKSIDGWLRDEWGREKSAAALTRLAGPDGAILQEAGAMPSGGPPPEIFPATTRFGTWAWQVWSPTRVETVWNRKALIAGLGVSLMLAAGSLGAAVAIRRSEQLAAQRVRFVNRASHELRTPLTNLMLNADLARDNLSDDPAAASVRLDRVSAEAARLSRLVDNLLTFSRRERNEDVLRSENLDPVESLRQTLGSFEIALSDRAIPIRLTEGESASLAADRDALVQVFGNLLSNVEKYAPGEPLRIDCRVEGNEWIVDFHDGGQGVPEQHRERIFEPFHRAVDRIDEGVSGTGLGLAIARDLTRRMGGDLVLVPMESGACFRVRFPVVATEARA